MLKIKEVALGIGVEILFMFLKKNPFELVSC